MSRAIADTSKGEQALETIRSFLDVMSDRQLDRLVDIGEALSLLYDKPLEEVPPDEEAK